MPDRSKTRPRDPNQLAYQIMLESTGQAPKTEPPVQKKKNPAAVALELPSVALVGEDAGGDRADADSVDGAVVGCGV